MDVPEKGFLILDANVLIDLLLYDKSIFKLISEYVGQVVVASLILEEVDGFSADECLELGITMVEPTLDQVEMAAAKPKPLSFYDWLCLSIAKDNGWTCVSNDKALRKICISQNITVLWELQMLCLLVEAGGLTPNQCKSIILSIQSKNPYFITELVVDEAFKRLHIER